MDKLIYDNLIISVREFMVLSALCGLSRVDLPIKGKQEAPDQKDVNLVLFQLYQKQILVMEEPNEYRLNPEIQKLFAEIKEAGYVIESYGIDKHNSLLLFSSQKIITAELSDNDRDAVKLRFVSRNRLSEELYSQKLLPLEKETKEEKFLKKEIAVLHDKLQKDRSQFIKNNHIDHEALMEYAEANGIRSFFIIKDRQSDIEKVLILLIDCGVWDCIARFEGDCLETRYYTQKLIEEFLLL